MWIVARYLPVAPFSLKPAAATSSGGKTLLAPTPYAIKMALLDTAIRTMGVSEGEQLFSSVRNLSVQIALPDDILVFKSFSKSWRPVESKEAQKKEETREEFEARQREKLADRIERGQYPLTQPLPTGNMSITAMPSSLPLHCLTKIHYQQNFPDCLPVLTTLANAVVSCKLWNPRASKNSCQKVCSRI
jgi:hypothetical protein